MPDIWYPRATRDGRAWTNYALNGAGGSKRVAVHTTENSQSSTCKGVADYMWNNAGASTGYSILYHPSTGVWHQLRPFNVGAGSLKNLSGGVETNKNGALNFQLSVVAYASEPWWDKYPLPGWGEFINWVRSWGIPDKYVQYTFGQNTRMSNSTWTGSSHGWYGHRHAPENDHTDPGGLPDPWALQGGASSPPPQEVYDKNAAFHRNLSVKSPYLKGDDVKWVQNYLNANGHSAGTADGVFGNNTGNAVKQFQTAKKLTVDGVVGKQTAAAMGMPGATGSTPTPTPPPTTGLGAFPLASGHWYGKRSDSDKNHSGYSPGEPASKTGWGGSGGKPQYVVDQGNIKRIQQSLGLTQDGLFGANTESAVKNKQRAKGLVDDGLVGTKTWSVL